MTTYTSNGLGGFVLLVGLTLVGCGGPGGATDGDCNARVLYGGEPYIPREASLDGIADPKPLGGADIAGCNEKITGTRVQVFPVRGVTDDEAVVVVDGDYRSFYVREDLPETAWSPGLRDLVSLP